MNAIQTIKSRRSVRKYQNKPISKEDINRLIELGTWAASGSNNQPWGFLVLDDRQELDLLSEKIKTELLENIDKAPSLAQYEGMLRKPEFHVFHNAPAVLVIYGRNETAWYVYDCTLAAANIMLGGFEMNIGSCWIGFAHKYFSSSEFKNKHNIPENYDLASVLSLGYIPEGHQFTAPPRKETVIFNR